MSNHACLLYNVWSNYPVITCDWLPPCREAIPVRRTCKMNPGAAYYQCLCTTVLFRVRQREFYRFFDFLIHFILSIMWSQCMKLP